jgi:hypothetical protein
MAASNNNLLKGFLLVVAVGFLYMIFQSKEEKLENVEEEVPAMQPEPATMQQQPEEPVEVAEQRELEAIDSLVSEEEKPLKAEDLLPKYDEASEFAKANPVSELLKEKNFLISGYHLGLNTVLQSNKIPYHDLRSAPPVVKEDVGPWNQSSFENGAGSNRRYFELGAY